MKNNQDIADRIQALIQEREKHGKNENISLIDVANAIREMQVDLREYFGKHGELPEGVNTSRLGEKNKEYIIGAIYGANVAANYLEDRKAPPSVAFSITSRGRRTYAQRVKMGHTSSG